MITPDRDRRDYGRNREENEQRKVEGFKTKFRLLANDLNGRIEDMTLGNVKHNTRQIEKLIETHDKLYAEISDTNMISSIDIELEDPDGVAMNHNVEPYPVLRKWSADLYDRVQALKDETTLHNEQRRREDKDRGDMIKQDNILIKLTGESNFLFWMDGITRIGDYLPKGTSQFKLTILIKGSIANAED